MARKLGEVLVEKRIIDASQLKKALDAQLIYGGHLGTCLVELGFVDVDRLGRVLSEQFRVGQALREKLTAIEPSVVAMLPAKLAERHQAVPFELADRVLHVAVVDPRNLLALDEISFAAGHRIETWIAPAILVERCLEHYYGVPRKLRHITVAGQLADAGTRRPHETAAPPAAVPAPVESSHAVAEPSAAESTLAPPQVTSTSELPDLGEPEPEADSESVPPTVFVEQARSPVHGEGAPVPNGRSRTLEWIKYERNGRQSWCELYDLPLAHEHFRHLAGVYVVFQTGQRPVLRVGQGYIKTELGTLRLDPRVATRDHDDPLYVTWAEVPREDRAGVERFLTDMLDPELPTAPPDVEPIVVNLPR